MQDGFSGEQLEAMTNQSYSNWVPSFYEVEGDEDLTASGMLEEMSKALTAAEDKVGVAVINIHSLVDRDFKNIKNLDKLIKQIEAAATKVSPNTLMVLTGF
jgi:hypothetical protein